VGVTYGYTGYPVIRQAREMIKRGDIGEIIHVRVTHPEDWVIESVSAEAGEELPWRFHPERVGESLCTADLGTHAEQLLVQFTGLRPKRVLAMLDTYPRHLPLETNTTVLLDLGNGISGELWASQIAIGKACDPEIYVVGTKGALEWHHTQPDTLRYTPKGGPTQLWQTGRDYTAPESRRLARVSAGHHEGFFEAFGNIYRSFCEVLLARVEGREAQGWKFPTIADGLDGMKFVAACVESHEKGNIWVEL
jgi:predicted dehydrogenase